MPDESLSAFISVETDALDAAQQLQQLPEVLTQVVTEVNQQLVKLGQENGFARVITDAERAALSIDEVQVAAEAAARALGIMADANERLQTAGAAGRITGAGGMSLGDIEAQNKALQDQIGLLEQQQELRQRVARANLATIAGVPAETPVGAVGVDPERLAAAQEAGAFRIGTGAGAPIFLPPEAAQAVGLDPARAGVYGISGSQITGNEKDPAAFREQALTLSAENLDAKMKLAADNAERLAAVEAEAASGIGEFVGTRFLRPNGELVNPNGGLTDPLTVQRLQRTGALGGGGGEGGGGFFGGLGSGFTGGGGDGFNLGDLGQQAGVIGRYVLIYQVFRDIEQALRESVDQALQFDRAVTDLSNRLQISKDAAAGLATNIGLTGTAAGLAPAETVGLAASYAGAFSGQADQTTLLNQGAQTATQVQVLTGAVKDDLPDTIAAVRAFNLNFSDTQRVLDAATSAAQNYGLANAHSVLPGLAQIGDLAAQSGFTLEQTANAIADIQTRTNDSSAAVAGELQRFLGREGSSAFQQVFAQQGINTTQPFAQELEQLSEQYDKLSDSQKGFITQEFGGGRAGVAALAFIEDYSKIIDNANKSLDEGGVAQKNYEQRLNDIVGVITAIRGELKELAKDIGTSGLGAGFGIALEAAKPFLELLDEAVRLLNTIDSFGGHFTLGRDLVLGAAEISAALALLGRLNIGSRIGGIFGRGGAGADGEATPQSVAADATTAALERLTAALNGTTAAAVKDTEVTTADTTSKARDAVATDADALSKTEDVVATDADALSKVRNAAATALNTGRSALGNIASLFGATGIGGLSASGLGGAATSLPGLIGGAIITQQLYDAAKKVFPAIQAAQATYLSAINNPGANLQDTAQSLRQAAQRAASSSSGLTGNVENYVGAGEGRLAGLVGDIPGARSALNLPGVSFLGRRFLGENSETSGDVVSRNRALAQLYSTEDARRAAASAASTGGGDFADMINLSKQGGVADGLKTLAALGLDSAAQLDALNQKLADFADASNGAANLLVKGGAALAAQNYANAATNDLLQAGQTQGGAVAAAFGSKNFINNVAPGLNQVIDQTAQDVLGPLQGQDITAADGKELSAKTQAAMVAYLERNGFSKDQIGKLLPDIHEAASAAVQQAIANINALHGQAISPDAVGGLLQALPGLLSGAAQQATQGAQLGRLAAPQGTAVAGANAALDQARLALQSLQRTKGVTAPELKSAQDLVDQYQVAANEAVLANIDTQAQLVAASIPPENQTDALRAHLSDLQQQLAVAVNPDDILRLKTDLAKTTQQIEASAAQDAISAIGINDNPADRVLTAQDALRKAQAAAADYVARGVDGQALNNAFAAVTQAQYQLAQAQVENANAQRDADVALGDTVGEAYAKYQDLLNTATTQAGGDQASTLRQAEEAYVAYLQARATQRADVIAAATDPRNVVGNDSNKLRSDIAQLHILQTNEPGATDDIAKLERQVAEDRVARARDLVAQQNARTGANARSGDPLAEAEAQLTEARRSLGLDERGTAQYYQDLKAVEDAEAGLAKAISDNSKNLALLRGDTTDPVAQAQADLAAARVQLAQDQARKTGNLGADQLAVETASQALQKAQFDQQLQLQQNAYDLHQESAGQYLQFLESQDSAIRNQLSGMRKGQQGYQQLVDELNTIDQAILGLNSQVEGQFNLGDIKVPTIYEVRRSIAEAQQQVIDASTTNNNVTINGVDITQVINYINGILGPAATGSRAASATRKAA